MSRWHFALTRQCSTRVSLFTLALALALTACGGGSASGVGSGSASGSGGSGGTGNESPSSGEYVWETGSQFNLSYATIDTTSGSLGSPTVAGSPAFGTTDYPSIAVSGSDQFLYAFLWSESEVETFQMNGPGVQLTLLNNTPTLKYTLDLPYEQSLAMTPDGKFLYVVESGGPPATIQEISVNATNGSLTLGSPAAEQADLREVLIDPQGKFLYVNDLSGGRIFAYQINQTDGSLTAVAGSPYTLPAGALPQSIVMGGGEKFLYAEIYSNGPQEPGGIDAYSIDTTSGALALVSGSPFPTAQNETSGIGTDPTGGFVYVSDFLSGAVEAYSVNASSGALSPVQGSPFAGGTEGGDLIVDTSGNYLYLTDYENSSIYGFSRNPSTGVLTALPGSPFPSVPQPVGLSVMNIP